MLALKGYACYAYRKYMHALLLLLLVLLLALKGYA